MYNFVRIIGVKGSLVKRFVKNGASVYILFMPLTRCLQGLLQKCYNHPRQPAAFVALGVGRVSEVSSGPASVIMLL
jgi:hypothetical protein